LRGSGVTAASSQHPRLAGVFENSAGLDDGEDVAERAEFIALVPGLVEDVLLVEVDFEVVAGADFARQGLDGFEGDEVFGRRCGRRTLR
jgi:hypothetical protein